MNMYEFKGLSSSLRRRTQAKLLFSWRRMCCKVQISSSEHTWCEFAVKYLLQDIHTQAELLLKKTGGGCSCLPLIDSHSQISEDFTAF